MGGMLAKCQNVLVSSSNHLLPHGNIKKAEVVKINFVKQNEEKMGNMNKGIK
jgi:hypothetical protein